MIISIVIPVYNVENYLYECINSILQQSASNWELILVDDGSTDGSGSICDEYKEYPNIRVIHEENQGESIARKTGCAKTTGEYVMFVDSDDYLDTRCIETVNNVLELNKVDIVRFSAFCEKKDRTVIRWKLKHHGLYDKEKIESEIIPYLIQNKNAEYYSPSLWGGVYRRELIEPALIEDRDATMGADGASIIPAIWSCDSIFFLDEPLYFYRYNNSSLTKSKKVINWKVPEIISKHIERSIDISSFDLQEQLYRKVVHDLFNVCVSQFNLNEDYFRIRDSIINNLNNNQYYKKAIKNAVFSGCKARLMLYALRFRLVFLMFIYSKVRYY